MAAFCIEFNSWDRFVFKPAHLKNIKKEVTYEVYARLKNCHIYLICMRPRIMLISIIQKGGGYEATIKYLVNHEERIVSMEVSHEELCEMGKMAVNEASASTAPHSEIILTGTDRESGRSIVNTLVFDLYAGHIKALPNELKRFKVLYVGKSVGEDEGSSATDRLKAHSTLQDVLSDANDKYIHDTVFCLAVDFPNHKNIVASVRPALKSNLKRIEELLNLTLSLADRTELTEACLISYFKPEYNSIYKDRFPAQDHKILRKIKKLEINTLTVNLMTETINVETFSDVVGARGEHVIDITLGFLAKGSFKDFVANGARVKVIATNTFPK